MAIHSVKLTERAKQALRKAPFHIQRKLLLWVLLVEKDGLERVRMVPGFHDEPLRGKRQGQRSIRLYIAYRAIYEIHESGTGAFVSVEDVTKHDY